MNYNWEEIFKSKSTKELYDIYCGNSMLQPDTIPFAKQELERRSFNFNDLEHHIDTWKLEEVTEDIDLLKFDLSARSFMPPNVMLTFAIIYSIVVIFLIFKYELDSSITYLLLAILILYIVAFGTNNYIFNKKQMRLNDLLEKKKILTEKILIHKTDSTSNLIIEKIETKSIKREKSLQTFGLIIMALSFLLSILLRLLK